MNETSNLKQLFTSLKIIYLGLVMGQIIFIAIFLFLVYSGNSGEMQDLSNILLFVAFVLVASAVFAANKIFNLKMSQIDENNSLEYKLSEYRTSLIIKFGILEGPSLLSIVFFFMTANELFLVFSILILGFFFIYRPSNSKIASDLKLKANEVDTINNL
jgi:magnesium-transporting ATPase (P-type)